MAILEFKDLITILGVLIAATSLVFTAINTRINMRTNRARFWLDLRDRFERHDEVHHQLRPGGVWTGGKGPETSEEWASLEAYMGLFEHCEVMLAQHLIDEATFRDIYAYRLRNIVANDIVRREKLQRLVSGWVRFLPLLKRMDIEFTA
ncbi:MAG: hypothetical protein ABIR84_02085 [Candidatus Nitrotoga sp.]